MSKNFEMLNKELDENNIKASLVIFPFAGGGVSAFRKWKDEFEDIKLLVAQYPGRENRFSEKAISDINILVDSLFEDMKETFDFRKPYYLFGHSMGTKIVYELALRIKNSDYINPRGIIISGGRAPLYKEPHPIYHLDDDGFIEGLRRYEGTPKEILDNKDLISIFLPTLRADFVIDEDYQDTKFEKLKSPILGLMGDKDQEMTLDELIKWQDYTTKEFTYRYIDGKHMFVYTSPESVIKEIKEFIKVNEN